MMLKKVACIKPVFVLGCLLLAGCQSLPTPEQPEKKVRPLPEKPAEIHTPSGVIIKPYDQEEIIRKQLKVVVPEQKSSQKFDDGHNLPAFRQLMQQTNTAYAKEQWSAAETAALHAQRLAPQSPEPFLYLAMIANRKQQPANAESLAKRGLSYAQTDAMKKQLWLSILKAGQMQKKTATILQAQTALKSL